jgi:hypothetical protein
VVHPWQITVQSLADITTTSSGKKEDERTYYYDLKEQLIENSH